MNAKNFIKSPVKCESEVVEFRKKFTVKTKMNRII